MSSGNVGCFLGLVRTRCVHICHGCVVATEKRSIDIDVSRL